MSWTLATPDGTSLEVNAWNRRPTVELPERAGVIDAETAGLLGYTIDVDLSDLADLQGTVSLLSEVGALP